MTKNNYEVDILINGRSVKEYKHEGKLYIEGRKGSRFSIRIRNNGWDEILAVPSVDGLSVMDGKLCSMYKSRGYIVKPHSVVNIDGWRTSDKEVAEFYFSDVNDSYAKRSGKGTENTGIIGVSIFGKKWNSYTYSGSIGLQFSNASGFPSTSANVVNLAENSGNSNLTLSSNIRASNTLSNKFENNKDLVSYQENRQDVATGFGAAKRSEIERIYFGREDMPREVFKIYYNTKERLEEIGVNTKKEIVNVNTPDSFPGDYCKPPVK